MSKSGSIKCRYRILHLSDLHLRVLEGNKNITEDKICEQILNASQRNNIDVPPCLNDINGVEKFATDKVSEAESQTICSFLEKLVSICSKKKNENELVIIKDLESRNKKHRLIHMIDNFEKHMKVADNDHCERFDMLVITGDIFDMGNTSIINDDAVVRLFNILSKLSDKIYIAFGNHDMNLLLRDGKVKIIHKNDQNAAVQEGIKYEEFLSTVNRIINSNERLDSSSTKKMIDLEKDLFIDFSKLSIFSNDKNWKLNEGMTLFDKNDMFTCGVSFIDERIAIVTLNSAWLNIDSHICHGQLITGKSILYDILNQLKQKQFIDVEGKSVDGRYVITLMHNDFNWHSVGEHHYNLISFGENITGKSPVQAITDFSDIILCGHEHKETRPNLLGLDAYVLKVGGTFRTHDGDNTFSVYTLDFNFDTLTRDVYRYADHAWKKADDYFITELKPKDAKSKFKAPHRSVDECFEIMKKNGIITGIDGESLMTYDGYMNSRNNIKRENLTPNVEN